MKKTTDLTQDTELSSIVELETTLGSVTATQVTVGVLTGFDHGHPLVDYDANRHQKSVVAATTTALTIEHIGREVALLFTDKPLVIGVIHHPFADVFETLPEQSSERSKEPSTMPPEASMQSIQSPPSSISEDDQGNLHIQAANSVTITCGESSLVLRRDGKILLRGRYLLSRATDVNRILGGSIQMN